MIKSKKHQSSDNTKEACPNSFPSSKRIRESAFNAQKGIYC